MFILITLIWQKYLLLHQEDHQKYLLRNGVHCVSSMQHFLLILIMHLEVLLHQEMEK